MITLQAVTNQKANLAISFFSREDFSYFSFLVITFRGSGKAVAVLKTPTYVIQLTLYLKRANTLNIRKIKVEI